MRVTPVCASCVCPTEPCARPPCRYGHEHAAVELQKEAVYGLTEIYREEVKGARLLANPGCYPTCTQVGARTGHRRLRTGICGALGKSNSWRRCALRQGGLWNLRVALREQG